MNSKQIENLTLLLITALVALAVYMLIYHPEWVVAVLTYRQGNGS